MRDYEEVVKTVVKVLNDLKIDYMIVGAVSVAVHGTPRSSEDVDVILMLSEKKMKGFVDSMGERGFLTHVEDIKSALREKSHFTIFDERSAYRIDCKGLYSKFDEQSFQRRIKKKVNSTEMWVNSPEDLILAKLSYGAPRDVEDVMRTLVSQKNLDRKYLFKEAKKMGVNRKLQILLEKINKRMTK